ncbi:acyl-CoA dehydrogenase family protein [Piscinibacter sp. XHJ-5]|uniref:acyl-CoA dehydrogenase family protein n=1 Tax=Piscinibacter sp. XHJ-5 TaxID=3037797 RepID=UPI002452F6A2|nr:acyl-CoA dehydrogenase family protein [Piscinibacter sp. XHJ-5]
MQDISITEAAEQQQMLRDSAADFVRGRADMKQLRERRGTLPGYDPATVQQMGELGWFAILVPEAHGGLGLALADMAVVLEELGKGLMAEPMVAAVLAARVLEHGTNEALKARLLPGLADASERPCVAWQEDRGGVDAAGSETRARIEGDAVVLTGTKRFVAGAAGASGFIVSAQSDAGLSLYWVDAGASGLSVRHEWRADETPSGVVELAGVRASASDALCAPGAESHAALERAVEEAAVMASAEMLGVMEAALQMALGYMRTRVQFGKPIGSFQALQHKTADLYVQQELCRAVLDDAVRALDGRVPAQERSQLASRCKARASDAGLRVTREVIQLHGAIGFTDEYDAGLYLKRALVLSAWLGNASAHRRRFAQLARGAVAA